MKYIMLCMVFIGVCRSQAQHCFWDMSSIIIIDVRDIRTGEKIHGLTINITDAKGVEYVKKKFIVTQKIDEVITNHPGLRKFPSYHDYYVLKFVENAQNLHGKFITIKDTQVKNREGFESKTVQIKRKHCQSLCVENPIWQRKDLVNKMKINVWLKKKAFHNKN
ncbi:hypothetical protein [uncultured Aquimarina sp.]|uniref:hypothetical protein n=1 Tax=uncultured Aquimarina sp. TaxID=575652 RepID=UPI002627EEE3|nr:hypothetical protein [uncultured Aquimarina sp.]